MLLFFSFFCIGKLCSSKIEKNFGVHQVLASIVYHLLTLSTNDETLILANKNRKRKNHTGVEADCKSSWLDYSNRIIKLLGAGCQMVHRFRSVHPDLCIQEVQRVYLSGQDPSETMSLTKTLSESIRRITCA
ncbi:uncharacterized protein BYT42DRAFT_570399 [Radiomyces spectabilis]|uniref:uncharacterized protein n=1 Tax=Radiomyces spectabilis TaxID=64574 RepID=UPI00221ED784|nr:uncharacterized protein BYT42DRAFT_570399 [Radiomyces spectabilis]KAI8377457.1 hypothetical protein BYT42DRAFT_570399 [Radiomyces spectabilis]